MYKIEQLKTGRTLSITPELLSSFKPIKDYGKEILRLYKNAVILRDSEPDVLLEFFDRAAQELPKKFPAFLREYSFLGTPFLLAFLKRSNLSRLLKTSLYGDLNCLYTFTKIPDLEKKIMALPRGVVTHWTAGNVLNLGIISLVQGILTKNANVVKLPATYGLLLPLFMNLFAGIKIETRKGRYLKGTDLLKTILFVYCDKNDKKNQTQLSLESDVRIIWGGQEAVHAVLTLPKKDTAEDIVFGPKNSFVILGKNSFAENDLPDLAYKLVLDISRFEQRACTSPHTIFIEKGGKISPREWARALSVGMEKALKRIPKQPVSANEAYSVVEIRSEYHLTGEVFSSKGTEWTIVYSDEKGLAEPCSSRVVFVRPVDDIYETLDFIDPSLQTLGLCLDPNRKTDFAEKAAARGIERITDIGMMHVYDYPWDGMFPMSRMVRWVSME
jgi:hypothetical protein